MLSIGAVLDLLTPDFPDLTISKVRFLEAEGLVAPARSPSGYRQFAPEDVERLRYVLTAQRDRFWPLKVIRDALDALDRGLEPVGPAGVDRPVAPPAPADPDLPSVADLTTTSTLRLTSTELADAAGTDLETVQACVSYALVSPDDDGYFGEPARAVVRAVGALAVFGVEPRHLRPFRTAADREIGLVDQAMAAVRSGAAAQTRRAEILRECIALHTALVRAGLRD